MKPVDVLLAISVAVLWGMGFIVAKAGMSHFSPILLMALRFTLTASILVWFFRPPPGLFKQLFLISLVSAALQYSLTFNGLRGIDASTAALLVQLEVPFGLILAWLVFGDRIRPLQALGIVIAFSGAVLIIGEPKLSGDLVYAFMVIGGAFTWAVGQIMIKKLGNLGGFRLISGVSLFAAPQLFVASFLLEQDQLLQIQSASFAAWGAVIYLGIIMTALAYGIWYRLLGHYSVNQVMPFLLLLPVTSVIGGIFFLGETLTIKIASGGCLAIIGVAMITIQRRPWRAQIAKDGSSI
ncbi:MAG: EamA family transporter [Gammaproteobacteria bacterium]|nr:EamA family transporter [Gammaproteobacteria bacterium]MDH3858203.1 EamA family transporter [Gammaproteobacteria bacterium]